MNRVNAVSRLVNELDDRSAGGDCGADLCRAWLTEMGYMDELRMEVDVLEDRADRLFQENVRLRGAMEALGDSLKMVMSLSKD